MDKLVIAVDFDGTCVEHKYPQVGRDVPYAVSVLKEIHDAGHEIILWTMRSGLFLDDAVAWFKAKEIPLFGANMNPTQGSWTKSNKAYAHIYIDDAALFCPLIQINKQERPYVDWLKVRKELHYKGAL